MFSAFTNASFPFSFDYFRQKSDTSIILKSVDIHDVETLHEKPARTLKHLLKLNHVNHSILFHHNEFHNHLPHILGSAYVLGANAEQLHNIYDEESKGLEPWKDSPSEVSRSDWRSFLGDGRYQRAYVDFFEDELVLNGYDWRKVVHEYLFKGKHPIVNCLIGGLGHPLIHLGYAFELSSREIAMEALGLATTCYNFLHQYLDDLKFTQPSTCTTSSPLAILQSINSDKRLDGLFDEQGAGNIAPLLKDHEAVVLEYWNMWHLSNPKKQFEDSQLAAAALLVGTHETGNSKYDFFLVHILTTSHAVRILLPFMPAEYHVPLVRQWWFLTIIVYIAQLRPRIDMQYVTDYELHGKDWDWVVDRSINGKYATDAHYVKGLRAMKEAANTWGDGEDFYLKAAAIFGETFDGWGGFGENEVR